MWQYEAIQRFCNFAISGPRFSLTRASKLAMTEGKDLILKKVFVQKVCAGVGVWVSSELGRAGTQSNFVEMEVPEEQQPTKSIALFLIHLKSGVSAGGGRVQHHRITTLG